MKILFIGYSNVLKRRVLPYIHEIKDLTGVDIARYSGQKNENIEPFGLNGEIYGSYDEGLMKSNAEIAYISTVNSAHASLAEKALKRGMHVVVDKPAFLSLDKSKELAELAGKLNLGLAEAVVYPFHSQIGRIKEIMANENLSPSNITINFSFPPLDPENFRYKKELGGGAINDLGPYAVSAGRIFFGAPPLNIFCTVNEFDSKHEVETSFSVVAGYSDGRSMTGHFGFCSEYINRINLLGRNFYFEINNVFTPKPDLENEVLLRANNSSRIIIAERSNCFNNFLSHFINLVSTGEHSILSSWLLQDAEAIEQLRMSISQNKI
jgi:dTDP-3,4-didehydro-2,6-dideoxy-alpha-D-glucose 3-reductase